MFVCNIALGPGSIGRTFLPKERVAGDGTGCKPSDRRNAKVHFDVDERDVL